MAHARVRHYKVTASDGTHFLEPFTEAQARYFATALEPDGVAIDVAIRMVETWNAEAKSQHTKLRYSIPFINPNRSLSEDTIMKEAEFRVTMRGTKRINLDRMASAIQTALTATMDADIEGTDYLNGSMVEYDGITVTPVTSTHPVKRASSVQST